MNKISDTELTEFIHSFYRNPKEAIQKIEFHSLDVNYIIDVKNNENMIYQATHCYKEDYSLIKYLLEKGANLNLKCKSGYNAFHKSIYNNNLDMIELFLQFKAEVNTRDSDGYTAFFLFLRECYAKYSILSVQTKSRCLNILENMLQKGADPKIASFYKTTAYEYWGPEILSVQNLLAKYENSKIEKEVPLPQKLKSNLKYESIAKEIWQKWVPSNGESETVQGELLRAIEKLRDEAQRNGNLNFGEMHKNLAIYVRDTLISFKMFNEKEIKDDIAKLMKKNNPYLEDDIYDRFCDKICEYYIQYANIDKSTLK